MNVYIQRMHEERLKQWHHAHAFGQDVRRPGESKTLIVIVITSVMMLVELVAGVIYGSMALLADGLHMASHAAALSINAVAYIYARRHAFDKEFSFGTGKVNTLGGFTGAVLLGGFAFLMVSESLSRLVSPVPIAFNQAILVAVLGLIVNGVSVLILEHKPSRQAADGHADESDEHGHYGYVHQHSHDHNLVSAYLHVLADALTSLLAIFALLGAKYFGFVWMDPTMGIIGAVLVARWSLGLLRGTSAVLLDRSAPEDISERIRLSIEAGGHDRVVDLHVWSIGPDTYAAIVSVVSEHAKSPSEYKRLIPDDLGIAHTSIEVHDYIE